MMRPTEPTKRRRRCRPEKEVQRDVVQALRNLGFEVCDLSQPRHTMLPLGLPDLYVRHPLWQLRVWIEVKAEDGKASLHQRLWHAAERGAGGNALVVTGVADLVGELKALGAPIR